MARGGTLWTRPGQEGLYAEGVGPPAEVQRGRRRTAVPDHVDLHVPGSPARGHAAARGAVLQAEVCVALSCQQRTGSIRLAHLLIHEFI